MKGLLKQSKPEGAENTKAKKGAVVARRVFMVLGIAACVILIPLLICNLILVIKGNTNKDEVPSLFSISQMYVLTDSMAPKINGGDLVFMKKVAAEEIVEEDIIAFFDPASADKIMVAHRVKEIHTDGAGNIFFLTKGDANNAYDNIAVPAGNLVGRYVFRLRGMGKVAMFMQSTAGLIISVSVPLMLLISGEIIRLVFVKKEGDQSLVD